MGAALVPLGELLVVWCAGFELIPVEGCPAGGIGVTGLVSYPADVWPGIGEHTSLRLELADNFVEPGPVVDLFFAIWALAVCTVEPDFFDGAIFGEDFGEHVDEDGVVFVGAVGGVVSIPWRKVDAHPQTVFFATRAELFEDIAFAFFVWRVFDGVG